MLHGTPTSPLRLNPELPPELERIINRALEKDRDIRYQTASDLRAELKRLKRDTDSGRSAASEAVGAGLALPKGARQAAPVQPRWSVTSRWAWPAAFLAMVLVIGLAVWFHFSTSKRPGSPLKIFPFISFQGQKRQPAFSPAGNALAFVWRGDKDDNADIYVKLIGAGRPLRLTTNPDDDLSPAWSPDGRYIAFFRQSAGGGAYYLVPSLGGPERN